MRMETDSGLSCTYLPVPTTSMSDPSSLFRTASIRERVEGGRNDVSKGRGGTRVAS
jgi:hypothetical protein